MVYEGKLNKVDNKLLAEEETRLTSPQLLAQTSYLMNIIINIFQILISQQFKKYLKFFKLFYSQ